MNKIRLGAIFLTAAMSFAATPSFAASPISNAFMANVQANLDFLSQASRLAETHAASSAARTFATAEQSYSARSVLALDAARPEEGTTKLAAADTDALMTGRSVAIDAPMGGPAKAANGRSPLGAKDISELARLSGKKFDDALWLKQVDALSQLRADYQAYADDGDDPALGKLAERELPQVEARLAALSKI